MFVSRADNGTVLPPSLARAIHTYFPWLIQSVRLWKELPAFNSKPLSKSSHKIRDNHKAFCGPISSTGSVMPQRYATMSQYKALLFEQWLDQHLHVRFLPSQRSISNVSVGWHVGVPVEYCTPRTYDIQYLYLKSGTILYECFPLKNAYLWS